MSAPVVREFRLALDHPVEVFWPLLTDTQRVNELVGSPLYEAYEVAREDGHVDVFGRLRVGPIKIEWQELPVNWIENQWFEQVRIFSRGPLREVRARMVLLDRNGQRFSSYRLSAVPKNILGRMGAAKVFSDFEGRLRQMIAQANQRVASRQPVVFEAKPKLPRSTRERAAQLVERIEATPFGHGLANKLVHHLMTGQEVDMWSLRPLAIAKQWCAPERLVVELFLQAVKVGLLECRWDVLCPRCRVSKAQVPEVRALPKEVHCPSCNIYYGPDFAQNVELAFSPGRAVRPIEYGFFCRSGPGGTPHVRGQITLEPGEQRSVPAALSPGRYRLRTLEPGAEAEIQLSGQEFPAITVTDQDVFAGEPSASGAIEMRNAGSKRRTIVIEDRTWLNDVLTAARVTTLQAFRDLFSEQVLRPGDDVSITNITFMFTDLVNSTSLFERVGDAGAYRVMREHFALLERLVREHDGGIVKTTGDGVHGAFNAPENALRAAVAMQRAITSANASGDKEYFQMRIGLHTGSSISVTLNERLDYYGSTVNIAARLEGEGAGGQITMSQAFVSDIAVQSMLSQLEVKERVVELKGIAGPVFIFLITPGL